MQTRFEPETFENDATDDENASQRGISRMRKYNSKNANAFVDATISHRNSAETLYIFHLFCSHVAAAGRK